MEMTREEFETLVFDYGTTGTKVFDGKQLTDSQIQDVEEAWTQFADNNPDDEEYEELFSTYHRYFNNDRFYNVVYAEKDLEGYYTGVGGMVGFDEKITNVQENAMQFETKKEAEKWISEHKEEWAYGDLSVSC